LGCALYIRYALYIKKYGNSNSNNRKFFYIVNVRMLNSIKELQTMEFAEDAMKFIAQNFK
jgi:hypothetical protein